MLWTTFVALLAIVSLELSPSTAASIPHGHLKPRYNVKPRMVTDGVDESIEYPIHLLTYAPHNE